MFQRKWGRNCVNDLSKSSQCFLSYSKTSTWTSQSWKPPSGKWHFSRLFVGNMICHTMDRDLRPHSINVVNTIQFRSIPKSQQKLPPHVFQAFQWLYLGDTFTQQHEVRRIAPARRALQRPMAAFWPHVKNVFLNIWRWWREHILGVMGFFHSEEKKGCSRIQAGLFRLNMLDSTKIPHRSRCC